MKPLFILLLLSNIALGTTFGIEYSRIPFQNIKITPTEAFINKSTEYIIATDLGIKEYPVIKFSYINYSKDDFITKRYLFSKLYEYYSFSLGKQIKIIKIKFEDYYYTLKIIPFIGGSLKKISKYEITIYRDDYECIYSGKKYKHEYYFSPVYSLTVPLAGFQISITAIPKERLIFSIGLGF
jgi:hypothetical protein